MKLWLNVKEGAEHAGVSRDTIYTACERRELHHVRIGGRRSIRTKAEYLDRTPFRRGTEVLVRMELEDNNRRRRISEQEEASLLAVAAPYLHSMIIAALDTGMRRGELLALRFGDIDWQARRIVLRGATTKSRKTRVVPIGTTRLMAVFEWLRLEPSAGGQAPAH